MADITEIKLPDATVFTVKDPNAQPKTLATPLTINGQTESTVEDALGGLNDYSDALKGAISNENLLDNGWFTVNQRGATTITGGYGADRWQLSAGTSVTFGSGGVTISNNTQVSQQLEAPPKNGVYTLSIKLSDGTIISGTAQKIDDVSVVYFVNNGTFVLYYYPTTKSIVLWCGSSVTIRAAKLELGSVSTLANDVAPNYTTELLKCRRYFKRIWDTQYSSMGICQIRSSAAYFVYQDGVPMRATPTMSYSGTFVVYSNGDHAVTGLTLDAASNKDVQVIYASADYTGAGDCGYGLASSLGSYVDLIADL